MHMNAPRAILEKLDDEGSGVRVEFHWLGDRLGHVISSVKGGVAVVEWKSVDDDPQGPVYQELHEQQNADGGKIVFLSGSGNGAHWSASVEFEKQKCVVAFDVAARVREEPVERAIEYRGDFEGRPAILCGPMHDVGRCELNEAGKLVRFLPSPGTETLPLTVRYQYAFQ
jgi:hypothetical protein